MVSIIVPVYNPKKVFLDRMINSVLCQTFHDFELLLIDDGSTDESLKICTDYALRDSRVKVFHKENGGVSSARNYGIDVAGGELILFSDDDDYMYPDFIENMATFIRGGQLLISGFLELDENEDFQNVVRQKVVSKIVEGNSIDDIRDKFDDLDLGWQATVWNAMFRKDIIERFHLRFRNIASEDELFFNEYLSHCASIRRIDYQGYLFIHHKGSQGHSHKYIAGLDFILLSDKIYGNIVKHFDLETCRNSHRYLEALKEKLAIRLCCYLLKGYHEDTKESYKTRLRIWGEVRKIQLGYNPEKTSCQKNYNLILNICKTRIYYFLDLFILLAVRIKDKTNNVIA